jgi:diaminopropionate ammonia-lyase
MATTGIISGRRFVLNPAARNASPDAGLFASQEMAEVAEFYRAMLGYSPTPLRSLGGYARELGVRGLLVKDESSRMGLNAFKIAGVAYALHRLRSSGALKPDSVLACATDGNHGRAVAHVARELRLRAKIYIHSGASPARVQAIRDEGADVTIIDGNYDDSVRQVARDAQQHGWTIVSDTAWPGYEQVPRDIMAGYTILMTEAAAQWGEPPEVVFVQAGVGELAGAVASWLLQNFGADRPFLVCCEPENAACVLESVRVGYPANLQGSLATIMAGLSCGVVSSIAWPILLRSLDACVAISDDECRAAVRKLTYPNADDPSITAGESGACGVASLAAIMSCDDLHPVREALRLNSNSRVVAINTEGATDPEAYRQITGHL